MFTQLFRISVDDLMFEQIPLDSLWCVYKFALPLCVCLCVCARARGDDDYDMTSM